VCAYKLIIERQANEALTFVCLEEC
jgi:hypothetical protein